jgi:hypothetical protein
MEDERKRKPSTAKKKEGLGQILPLWSSQETNATPLIQTSNSRTETTGFCVSP